MEEITRFDMDMDGSMEPSDHGQWVRYEDVPQRTWVGLTLEDKEEYLALDFGGNRLDAMDWAARKLKEKNT